MRIISTFTDYYDSVQSLGIDKSCVYVRKESQELILSGSSLIQFFNKKIDKRKFYASRWLGWDQQDWMTVEQFVIGYCGKIIRAHRITRYEQREKIETKYLYQPIKVYEYFEKYQKVYSTYSKKALLYYEREMERTKSNPEPIEFNAQAYAKDLGDLFQTLQSPLFIYPAKFCPAYEYENTKRSYGYQSHKDVEIFLNPSLTSIDFYAYKDPYSCYQDIYQFLSGVLTKRENSETSMTEKQKVNQHGFDETYGFRTRPGSKKKRKKKKNR